VSALGLLTKLIKNSEGCKLNAYQCPAGVWTVGYGCTGNGIVKGTVWTQIQADQSLHELALKMLDDACRVSPILATASVSHHVAIADFIYNCGEGNYQKSTLKLRVDKGEWVSAQTEIKKWNKGGGKILPGLVIRRQKEADMLGDL
jgi:lysozyme